MQKDRTAAVHSSLNRVQTRRWRARQQARSWRFAGHVENLEPRQLLTADPVISEFVAFNTATIADEDGAYSDWLEVQNQGDMTADLSGYYLTDDASELDKWRVPNGTSLAPGEAIVVFASGKDRTGDELHTNFTVDELGGDLALVAPNGSTIVSDFTGHPALGRDQAYGSFRPSGDANFVTVDSASRILVPNDDGLGTIWTGGNEPFDDAAWIAGAGAIGFDTRDAAGVFTVSTYKSTSQVGNLAAVDSLINGNNVANGFPVTQEYQVVNFEDTSSAGNFGGNVRFPGLPSGDNNDFAILATTTFFLSADQAGDWTFGFASDDGGRLRIDGIDVIVDDRTHGTENILGSISLAAGQHSLEYVFFERGGGAGTELFAAPGIKNGFDNTFSLIGDPEGVLPLTSLDTLIDSDIQAQMSGQNASAYLRYEFDVRETADLTSMTLGLDTDDGAIVYLNGTEVLRHNAPASPTFNSTAVAESGLANLSADVTSRLSLLHNGTNVLAIHGLNAGANDEEFFVNARLTARELGEPVADFIAVPTPGADNADVDPIISEFLADNNSILNDEDGDSSDWIELHNPGVTDVVLTGWYLSDDPTLANKWQLPTTILEAGEYFVVFASGKDRVDPNSELHTNFRLNADGDYLALVRPDGQTVQWEYDLGGQEFSEQFDDVSFGVKGAPMFELGENDPIRGLVAYWDFEDGSGTTLSDVTGNGFDGTIRNMEAGDWVAGRKAGTSGLSFDGVDEFVETGATASDLDIPGRTPRTIAGWARGPVFFEGKTGGIFELGSPENDFSFRSTSILGTTFGLEYNDERMGARADQETWFHFAATFDGENVRLFIDGLLVGEDEFPDLFTDDAVPFKIGTLEADFVKGEIDEIAVWDMPLDADLISDLAADTITPFEVPTISRLIGVDRDGFSVRQVTATGQVGVGADPLSEADALLALPAGDPGVEADFTFRYDVINLHDSAGGGSTGLFGLDEAFPDDDFLGDDDDFAIHVTANLRVPAGADGDFIFAVNSSDGSRLRIDGADVIVDNTRHDASISTGTVTLSAGDHALDLVHFERDGEASLELMYASMNNQGIQDGDFVLIEILPDQRTPEVAPPVTLAPRVFFPNPTPGAANNQGVATFVGRTSLSVDHGFFDEPFILEITNETPLVDIWYTTDGTVPEPDNLSARLYEGPMTISSTTALRAAAYLENAAPSEVTTATYLFIDDVLRQSPSGETPPGFPDSWGANSRDYGMDPDIVNSAIWGPQLEAALTQVPTMSLVMNNDDLFGTEGIYSHAGNRGRAWERPASLELINPDGSEGFQVEAGVRIRGGFSRSNNNPKHAFRFYFRQEYGDSKLNYPLFGDEGVDFFDKIDLRTTQNYSWAFQGDGRNAFLRDIFSRDMQLAMGQNSTRGEFYHMYINGQYWGLFQTDERVGADYAAAYDGGQEEDYDLVHNNTRDLAAIDGTMDSTERIWSEFVKPGGLGDANAEDYWRVQGMNPDGTRNLAYERLLDVDNLIDYMVITYYTSDADGPGSKFTRPGLNNYFAYYNRENPDGWKFIEHDSEHSLDTSTGAGANGNMVTPFVNNGTVLTRFNAHWAHEQLAETNSDYRQRFIDRVAHYFADDGLFGDDNVIRMLESRAAEIDMAIIAESARWGDAKRGTPFTKNDWENAVQTAINWIDGRREDVLDQFRGVGWYPDFDAPVPEPTTGTVAAGSTVRLAVPGNAELDERLFSSSSVVRTHVPTNGDLGLSWTEPGFSDSSWSFGTGDVGYEDGTGYEDLIRRTVPSGTTSVYIRPFIKFSVADDDGDGDLADEWDEISLHVRYDDGFIAYLNGVEIARANAPLDPAWNSTATQNHDDAAAVQLEEFALDDSVKDLLMPTGNVLAVHALNVNSTSSDFLMGFELWGRRILGSETFPGEVYYTTDGSDPRQSNGGGINPTAVLYDDVDNVVIDDNTLLTARGFLNGQWSAVTQEFYQVLVPTIGISEINYNPYDPTDAELAVDPDLENDDFEWLEIINTGTTAVPLLGLQFTDGIEATLPDLSLVPGERGVIVKDRAAFELRYGNEIDILTTFDSGRLNNAGEQIALVDGLNQPILDMTYNDVDPWPSVADGVGGTLEFTGGAGASYSKYSSWSGSTDFGGSPGTAGSEPIGVVINEVLAHTDPPVAELDSIELVNTTSSSIDISGWYLSDAAGNLLKYQIPSGAVLAPGGYIVFDESQFNPTPESPGPNDFALSGVNGDDVYLVIADEAGSIAKIVDDVHFGASRNGESFGRTPDGAGRLAPMLQRTLGEANSTPRVGPVIITELNYDPGLPSAAAMAADPNVVDDDLEFVEVHNPTVANVDLTNWRIRGGIDLEFDEGSSIGGGETVVVISFNPDNPDNASRVAAFRAHYGIDESVRFIGGYGGELSNNDERVQLQRPDEPPENDPLNIPHVIEDEVLYDATAPWPDTSDGSTIQRDGSALYGNAVASWTAAAPTPGTVNFIGGVAGDYDGNNVVNATDIDLLYAAINAGNNGPQFDLDGSATVDSADVRYLVENIIGTFMGDANLDGVVTAADLNAVGLNWQGSGGWANGDFTGDGRVTAGDLNVLGLNWQQGARQAARAPRAPLAAVAPVDAVFAEFERPQRTVVRAADDAPVERPSARQREGLGQRRWTRESYHTLPTRDRMTDDIDLMDDLFAGF